jgi:hypothetical protein
VGGGGEELKPVKVVEAILVFPIYKQKYSTLNVVLHMKLKLLKNAIWCKNFKTLANREIFKNYTQMIADNFPFLDRMAVVFVFLIFFAEVLKFPQRIVVFNSFSLIYIALIWDQVFLLITQKKLFWLQQIIALHHSS